MSGGNIKVNAQLDIAPVSVTRSLKFGIIMARIATKRSIIICNRLPCMIAILTCKNNNDSSKTYFQCLLYQILMCDAHGR